MKKLSCVVVETRPLPDLVKIINNHLKFLPSDVDLFIFHSPQNSYLKKLFPQANFTQLSGEMNEYYYNFLLTSLAFWERFLEYNKVLIFQHDSMILRPGIEEFLEMDVDYLGSEWKFPPFRGNGGLSLRTPQLMYEITNNWTWDVSMANEDVAFCNYMVNNNFGKLASVEQCRKFACESVYTLGSWGIHAINKWLTPEQCEEILHQYD